MRRVILTSRNRFLQVLSCLVTALVAGQLPAWAAPPEPQYPQVVPVAKTFNNMPFSYRIESRSEKSNCVVYRLTYPSPVVTELAQNNTVPAEYYVPLGMRPEDPKRPAVICMHILDGNMELVRMTATQLASHGIAAVLFKLPYYGERGPPEGPRAMAARPQLLVSAMTQGIEDMRRTIDLLASRPEVDPERIGITGISLGGIVAATSAGSEPRLSRAMLVLAGGDLLTMIHHARETEELSRLLVGLSPEDRAKLERAIRAVDPLRHAPGLRERARAGKVLMVNAAEDEVIPRPCTDKLARALGIADRVEWLDGLGHYTSLAALPQIMERMVVFFAEDLPPTLKVQPPPSAPKTPLETVLAIVEQAIGFLTAEPIRGRCHAADLAVTVTPAGEKTYEGRLLFIRGAEGRFKLECKLPVVGDVAIGQGKYPWMASARRTLFRGVESGGAKPQDPVAFADPEHLVRIRMVAGAIAGARLAPEILEPLAAVTGEPAGGRDQAIRIALKGRNRGTLRLLLGEDGKTPRALTFDFPGAQGAVKFNGWQTNTVAHEAMFDPPAGLTPKEVPAEELRRVFSAMFNFAMEKAQ